LTKFLNFLTLASLGECLLLIITTSSLSSSFETLSVAFSSMAFSSVVVLSEILF